MEPLGIVLRVSGVPWRPLGGVLWASWRPLGGILGASWGRLGSSWKPLGASWRRLGASWGRLGLDFRSKRDLNGGIPSWMAFSNRFLSDLPSENRSPNFEKSLNSMAKIIFFSFQAVLT